MKENGHTYLVARVSSETIDAMAAFEAEGEDMENDLCDEPSEDPEMEPDSEPEPDEEPDAPGLRRRFIADNSRDACTSGTDAASSTRRPMTGPGTTTSSGRSSAR